MKDLVARLIAYVFLGSFCIAGPLCLVIALGSAVQRAGLIFSGMRAEGTVIGKQQMGSTRVSYAPVVQFVASDGRAYVVSSDVYGRESAFKYGEHVNVLYRQDHPESARIDAFAPLWTFPLVFGVVGAAFSVVPAIVLASWMRRRRTSQGGPDSMDPAQVTNDTGRSGVRWALGLLLTGGGLALLAVGLNVAPSDANSLDESRVFVICVGVLLAASGIQAGQWVATGSRLSHALGAVAITSMAVLFGWVAVYGQAAGFSGGVSIGGATVTSGRSVTPARIAFGIASILVALASAWAWKQVFRRRG
ncbi:MAG TPA: DUF3592 domain-containing protein [Steroidobacteraceae bacterium]|nr:DUF3592 domain-containing protein [Steroidobacteraceae bacterium]